MAYRLQLDQILWVNRGRFGLRNRLYCARGWFFHLTTFRDDYGRRQGRVRVLYRKTRARKDFAICFRRCLASHSEIRSICVHWCERDGSLATTRLGGVR
jgi:hypothetical protein